MSADKSGQAAFPPLDEGALGAFGLLGSPLYIFSFVTGRVVWSNPRAREFWNAASNEELLGRDLGPFSPATTVRLADYRAAFRGSGIKVESWTFYPAGKAVSALCRCTGVSLPGHDEAMLVEIQTLKPVDLPVSELRAIEAVRHTPLMISLFSQTGEVLVRNPAALHAFGEFDDALPADADHLAAMFGHADECAALIAAAGRGGTGHASATVALPDWPVHSIQLSQVTDPVTGLPAYLVAQQDISALVTASRRVAASEEALDAVLNLNVAPVLVVAAEGNRVLKANYAAQALLGTAVSAGSADCAERFIDAQRFEGLRGTVLASGSGTAVLALRDAGGSQFWCSLSGARIRYADRDAMVLLITNVDQVYQAAAELEVALDVERRTSDMQRRLMAIAAHDLRTPLAVIDSTALQIERRAESLPADQLRARAGRIRTSIRRLLELFDRTLDRASPDLGAMGYAPERGQLAEVVAAVVQQFRDQYRSAELRLELPDLPEVALDRALMAQALANLIGNAIKYSDRAVRVEISASAGPEWVELLIRDHGIGIPQAERESVFAENVRGANVGNRPGTGLGLSIVRQIVQLHGGLIEVVDCEGPGTAIRLALPRA